MDRLNVFLLRTHAGVLEENDSLPVGIQVEAPRLAEELNASYSSPIYEEILSVIKAHIENITE